jgi:stearoyl-CoA desaturase (delta-9 desaturase)
MGWLCCKKHPDVKTYGNKVDMSDMERDPIIMFQHRYFFFLMPIACFLIPTYIPTLWGVSLYRAFYVNVFRYVLV